MDPSQYTGTEWKELMKRMSSKEIRKVVKRGYTAAGKEALKIARQSLATSGPKVFGNGTDWPKAIRQHNYSKGGGFMATVKPRGKRGFHNNRYGKEKPIVMWAEEGTKERKTRGKGLFKTGSKSRGRMPAYGFLEKVEGQMFQKVESALLPSVEEAVRKAAAKAGLT